MSSKKMIVVHGKQDNDDNCDQSARGPSKRWPFIYEAPEIQTFGFFMNASYEQMCQRLRVGVMLLAFIVLHGRDQLAIEASLALDVVGRVTKGDGCLESG